ncbi:MAG: allantoate amidohydrolase [Ktedonobacterales bacterium]|nr:allantoate amidohydrolase [Ktedonobacterales bacterium]
METHVSAHTLIARCALLGAFSEEPDRLTRRYATPPMRQVNQAVTGWMRAAGMTVRQDNIGNLIGRYEAAHPDTPTLLLGSHLDTVRDAGQYDGPLGVLVALACVERLHARDERLPFAIELLAFCDEEGLRYPTTYLGSATVAGAFDPAWRDLTDDAGIPLAEALQAFGGAPAALPQDTWHGGALLGYCEVHIEQGPVLEAAHLPLGLVTAIQGQSRFTLTFRGEAGHAGTVPMHQRHDALCAAAAFVLEVERAASATPGLVATVGQLNVAPGASNVIPGQVTLSLDVRHPDDATRAATHAHLRQRAEHIAATRRGVVEWQLVGEQSATPCSPQLTRLLERAAVAEGYPPRHLASGAGHDAVMMARLTDIAMLFVRCAGGISHSPAEAVAAEDVAAAIAVLERFLALLAEERTPPTTTT